MALFQSQVLTKASGSVGGLTYSRSSQGNYLRARSVPVNPRTDRQATIRGILRDLVNDWSTVLSPAQRAAWNLYGRNVTRVNRLGDAIKVSGQNWYVASNSPRAQAGTLNPAVVIPRVDDGPTVYTRGQIGTYHLPVITVAGGLSMSLNQTPDWSKDPNAYLLLYMGKPQNGARSYFRGPWRLVGAVAGDSAAPPSIISLDTATLTAAYAFALSNNVWIRTTAVYPDGRFSAASVVGPITVTA